MAFKPSARRSVKVESTELDLRPIMNMMCILIPLLLSCSEMVKNTYIELNLPQLSSQSNIGSSDKQDKPKEEKPRIGLKLIITEKGITIAGNSAILGGESAGGPTVPKTAEGKHDFVALKEKLAKIKKSIEGKGFEDDQTIIITAEDIVEYQVIVTTMDFVRASGTRTLRDPVTNATMKVPWFTNIGVGKIII
jgi:biopolymer transport protein ExbD